MAGADAFQVEGVVVEVLSNGTYRLELANGYRLLGFVSGRMWLTAARFEPGQKLRLQLSPYDLSQGRIIVESKTNI
jgi:translation initiation factor IF-1